MNVLEKEIVEEDLRSQTKHQDSAYRLHKYVFGMIGIFVLFIASYLYSMQVVKNSGRYMDGAAKTLGWQDKQKQNLP